MHGVAGERDEEIFDVNGATLGMMDTARAIVRRQRLRKRQGHAPEGEKRGQRGRAVYWAGFPHEIVLVVRLDRIVWLADAAAEPHAENQFPLRDVDDDLGDGPLSRRPRL